MEKTGKPERKSVFHPDRQRARKVEEDVVDYLYQCLAVVTYSENDDDVSLVRAKKYVDDRLARDPGWELEVDKLAEKKEVNSGWLKHRYSKAWEPTKLDWKANAPFMYLAPGSVAWVV